MSQMDLIYQNSEVTIVAAAGEDPEYDLPGVGRRKRRQQPQTKIGSTVLISPLPKTAHLIAKSQWAKRAWTYQESLLSRRRLVFTDEQVYFQCHGTHCYEAHPTLMETSRFLEDENFVKRMKPVNYPGGGVFPTGVGTGKDAICARISEYLNKSLTRQSDKLNAFLGILRVFEMRGTYNCWGTPILHHSTDQFLTETSRWKMEMCTGFVRGLCWTSLVGLWPSEDREPYLPSW